MGLGIHFIRLAALLGAMALLSVTLAGPLAGQNPPIKTPKKTLIKSLLLDTPKAPVAAYEFTSHTYSGKTIRLADLKGKVVVRRIMGKVLLIIKILILKKLRSIS